VKKAKPAPKAKPVKKAKPKAKPTPKAKPKTKKPTPKPKAKPVKKKVAKTKTSRKKKEKVQVPPKLGWPPAGTVVEGKFNYIVPQPGEEPTVLKGPLPVPKKHFANGTVVPGDFKPTTRKNSNAGVVVNFQKGVEGWPAHIRVTRNDELVTNIFNKSWKGALDNLRANYGINLLVPKLM
jgi:hypothetical protein